MLSKCKVWQQMQEVKAGHRCLYTVPHTNPCYVFIHGSNCATLETDTEGELSLVCHRENSKSLENVGL